jgi:hypothetical protein
MDEIGFFNIYLLFGAKEATFDQVFLALFARFQFGHTAGMGFWFITNHGWGRALQARSLSSLLISL